jgi:hypothetical protein
MDYSSDSLKSLAETPQRINKDEYLDQLQKYHVDLDEKYIFEWIE